MTDPNDYQGRGEQPPIDGTGVILATIAGFTLWLLIALIAWGLDQLLSML